jgi:hypothetical protein
MNPPAAGVGQVDYSAWLLRLLTWDGLLPIGMLLVPVLAGNFLPNRAEVGLGYTLMIVGAALLRVRAGCLHIDANHCSETFQRFQVWLLIAAVGLLLCIDAFLLIWYEFGCPVDWSAEGLSVAAVFGSLVLLYALTMAIVMYPGRGEGLPEVLNRLAE